MKFLARVNPKYFAAITLFMAKQDVRYYLNGVSVEPHPDGGVLLVATDGHRIGVLHDPDGWCESKFIVGNISKALLLACKAKVRKTDLHEAPAALWIGETGSLVVSLPVVAKGETAAHEEPADAFGPLVRFMCKTSIVDGKFPDWRRTCIQKRLTTFEEFPGVNSEYLFDVSLAQNIILGAPRRGLGYRGIKMEVTGQRSTIVVRVEDGELHDRFFVLVMPMRAQTPDTILPKFMPQEAVPEVEAASQ